MSVRLEPPTHEPTGPDGQGHNRLAVIGRTPRTQCALRPMTEGAFWESRDTQRARWGNCAPCDGPSDCNYCRRLRHGAPWLWATETVTIRIDEKGQPWVMNRPDRGWAETGLLTSWEALAAIDGATFRCGQDAHGRYILATRRGVGDVSGN